MNKNFLVNALDQKVNNYKKEKNHQNISFGVILGFFQHYCTKIQKEDGFTVFNQFEILKYLLNELRMFYENLYQKRKHSWKIDMYDDLWSSKIKLTKVWSSGRPIK